MSVTKEEALKYHSEGRPGKIEVVATKPCFTSRDLSLAYTPGVAEPCLEIEKNPDDIFKYTAKGNLVAVVSNGTAVLGLGAIGAGAGKPVMEGKGVLFKRFADIDVFDIELDSLDSKEIIRAVKMMEPTFGGINLEDIKAPECFEIEEELKKISNIPIFHDDQHGTAIISCAALINAAEVAKKNLAEIRLVVSGAGASAIACCNMYLLAGVKRENIFMFDSTGLIHKDRTDLNKYKMMYANENKYDSLVSAMVGADVFVGLSKGNVVSKDMVKSMGDSPIIFAMANPDPEILYWDAKEAREDLIMATGRSDFPNQVNNVLGFPFIFRGALDVRATCINEEMKMAATKALSELAKEKVPDVVIGAYGGSDFSFGADYIIPKPFDPRVLWKVAPAVARAAMETGVAQKPIEDWHAYEEELQERLGFSNRIVQLMSHKARKSPKKIVYPEGNEEKIIRAANAVASDGLGSPILIGNKEKIEARINELNFDLAKFEIKDPETCERCEAYAQAFYAKRQRKGVTMDEAVKIMKEPNYYASMMLCEGDADAVIGGLTQHYPAMIRPALQAVGKKKGGKVVAGVYIVMIKNKVYFFADTTVNFDPDAETLSEIAIVVADAVKKFEIDPKVAMLSFSNFGSAQNEYSQKVQEAVRWVRAKRPDIVIDGEMQADTAVVPEIVEKEFPFCAIKGGANVLIFPNLSAGNIAYKLFERLTDATVIGPILVGMNKPVHVLQRGASVEDIINMTAIAVVEAEEK
ncbi:MAG: NADP-dependent malic enzyme [Bacteroidetes bacterium]|nr:NADP-dependent malic enzyme [Bacteroidota bacterium]